MPRRVMELPRITRNQPLGPAPPETCHASPLGHTPPETRHPHGARGDPRKEEREIKGQHPPNPHPIRRRRTFYFKQK